MVNHKGSACRHASQMRLSAGEFSRAGACKGLVLDGCQEQGGRVRMTVKTTVLGETP